MTFEEKDERWMQKAYELSKKARAMAPPNPWVGCVIVKENLLIGEGHTSPPGQAHAEIKALAQASSQVEGSSLYVTLEPCNHYGRTPPCVEAIIRAKIKRVFVGLQDPDPLVSGKGIEALKNAGIEVFVGLMKDQIAEDLASYIYHRKTGKPYCVLKAAMSLDGRTVAEDGKSQWITPSEARHDAHLLRAQSQAVMIGAGTALQDFPSLTVRNLPVESFRPPLRVVLDSQGRLPTKTPLFDTSLAPTCIMTTEKAPISKRLEWEQLGCQVQVISSNTEGNVNLNEALKWLGNQGVLQLMVEGGATLHEAFWRANLVQKFVVYIGPRLLGCGGEPLLHHLRFSHLNTAPTLTLVEVARLGQTAKLTYLCPDSDTL